MMIHNITCNVFQINKYTQQLDIILVSQLSPAESSNHIRIN